MSMEKKFYVGQEVLCIKTHQAITKSGNASDPDFIKGKKYTVTAVKRGCCSAPIVLMIDNPEHVGHSTFCMVCGVNRGGQWYNSKNFIPIDNELSETTSEELIESLESTLTPQN